MRDHATTREHLETSFMRIRQLRKEGKSFREIGEILAKERGREIAYTANWVWRVYKGRN